MPTPNLVIIGGHEDRSPSSVILGEFVARAGGAGARIVVVTAATSDPEGYGESIADALRACGAGVVVRIDTADAVDAADPAAIAALESATGVFLTGGDQARATAVLLDTPLHDALLDAAARGVVIAGTSAGAALIGDVMVSGTANPHYTRGLGLWRGTIIDQHFTQRSRLSRLTDASVRHGQLDGYGIDENTALVVSGGGTSVIGEGTVTRVVRGVVVVRRGRAAPTWGGAERSRDGIA